MHHTYVTGEASTTPILSRINERDFCLKIEGVEIVGDRPFLQKIADAIAAELGPAESDESYEASEALLQCRERNSHVHPHFRGLLSSICSPESDIEERRRRA